MVTEPEVEAPSWIDNDFIETLLRDNEHDPTIVVRDIDVRSAVGKGENYASRLHRVTAHITTSDGTPGSRHLIVKSLPESEMMAKFINEAGIFDRETRMHLQTLPSMYNLEKSSSSNHDNNIRQISCKSYKTTRPSTIVMDDLQQLGYKMADRHKGLDLKHSKLAISALARLHALSWGLQAKDPTFKDDYGEHLYVEEKREMSKQFTDQAIKALTEQIEKWEGFERFAEKIRKVPWIDLLMDGFNKKGGLSVLNHGDAWVNNMMFTYEDDQVQDVKLLDFQMSRFVSLGMDLQYFLHTSPNEDIRSENWDELLEEYHKVFTNTLKSIDYDGKMLPSLDAVKKEVDHKMYFGMFTSFSVLPIVLADPTDAPDLTKMTEENMAECGEFDKSYSALRYRKVLQNLLLHFEKIGLL